MPAHPLQARSYSKKTMFRSHLDFRQVTILQSCQILNPHKYSLGLVCLSFALNRQKSACKNVLLIVMCLNCIHVDLISIVTLYFLDICPKNILGHNSVLSLFTPVVIYDM